MVEFQQTIESIKIFFREEQKQYDMVHLKLFPSDQNGKFFPVKMQFPKE